MILLAPCSPKPCILPIAYWANVYSYVLMLHASKVYMESNEFFQKQTYRNRCQISAANGVQNLTIPVDHVHSETNGIRDIVISYTMPWQQIHLKSLVSAYQNSPFFEYYVDDIAQLYQAKPKFLWDFLWSLQEFSWECIGRQPSIQLTIEYQKIVHPDVNDLRTEITPKSTEYKNAAETMLLAHPYYQVFDAKFGFIPNLSILDLIFNMGPESLLVLEACGKTNERVL